MSALPLEGILSAVADLPADTRNVLGIRYYVNPIRVKGAQTVIVNRSVVLINPALINRELNGGVSKDSFAYEVPLKGISLDISPYKDHKDPLLAALSPTIQDQVNALGAATSNSFYWIYNEDIIAPDNDLSQYGIKTRDSQKIIKPIREIISQN